MFDPPNSYPNPGSYEDVLKRMIRRMQQHGVDDRIVEMLQQAFEKELEQGHIILSRPERNRLLRQVSKAIITDALGKFDETQPN